MTQVIKFDNGYDNLSHIVFTILNNIIITIYLIVYNLVYFIEIVEGLKCYNNYFSETVLQIWKKNK